MALGWAAWRNETGAWRRAMLKTPRPNTVYLFVCVLIHISIYIYIYTVYTVLFMYVGIKAANV